MLSTVCVQWEWQEDLTNDENYESVIWADLHYLTHKRESNQKQDHYHLVVERYALLSYLSALSLLHWS